MACRCPPTRRAPEVAKPRNNMHPFDHSASGMADKLRDLQLEEEGQRTSRSSRGSVRMQQRRRRRVRVHVWPVLALLRTFRLSMARSIAHSEAQRHSSAHPGAYSPRIMDPRLPGSKLGVFLAKLHYFSSQRARRIHSFHGSYNSLDDPDVLPLLPCPAPRPVPRCV